MSAGHPRAHIPSDTPAEEAEEGLEEGFRPVSDEPWPDPVGLAQRLDAVAHDRAAPAVRVVQETASVLRGWIRDRPSGSVLDGQGLERELACWSEEQGWRGPCALWLDGLRRTWSAAAAKDPARGGKLALEELALEMDWWLRGDERDAQVWNGEPLAPGRRLPSRRDLADRAASDVGAGESVLVTSWSETVALSLEAAWRAGRRPEVFVGEGSPDLDGRRMARRLARGGIRVTMVYDATLAALVPRVDRVWLATEAIGAGTFLARRGTGILLEECARRDVPALVLATSDKLVPGGGLRLPAWCERERWRLWEDAPEGVSLESQSFETVPIELLELVGRFVSEAGRESAAALHLRSLRVETAPPCGTGTTVARAR
jgi:hypothetical protein